MHDEFIVDKGDEMTDRRHRISLSRGPPYYVIIL